MSVDSGGLSALKLMGLYSREDVTFKLEVEHFAGLSQVSSSPEARALLDRLRN